MATLLYVDDNPRRLQVVTARLTQAGYEVLIANDGEGALEIFEKKRVDLAVVDYYLHGMGGDLVAVEMKRLRSEVPIVIFSGAFTLPEMVLALADGFVYTGEGTETLMAKVDELLPRPKRSVRARRKETGSAA